MSSTRPPSPSLLIEQMRSLELQVPVLGDVPSATSTERVATANQVLADARSQREFLAAASTEAKRKLSEALLDVALYSEKVESSGCLLVLADILVGQIRARMRLLGIPINSPPTTPDIIAPSDSVNGPVTLGSSLCSMVLPTAPGDAAPTPPEGFMEYLALLSQNSSLLSALQTSSLSTLPMPLPPTQGRSFSRPNRGTGGALAEKQKASKDITASATKRKALVDPDVETLPSSEATTGTNGRQAKRPKPTRANGKRPSKLTTKPTPGSTYPTPAPDPPADPGQLPSPISSNPPTTVRPMPRPTKTRVKVQPPEHFDVPPVKINLPITEVQDIDNDDEGDSGDSEPEVELPTPTNDQLQLMPTLIRNLQSAASPVNLLQAFFAQISGASTPAFPVQLSTTLPSQGDQSKKASKGIKAFPDGWQKVLNSAKDVIRGWMLLKNPFPTSKLARLHVNEAFHEVLVAECGTNGLVLEPGFSWSDHMLQILLNELSTSRSELKKLAKILVGSDPEIFPSLEDQAQAFQGQPAPEIRFIAAKFKKQQKRQKSGDVHPDPNHVRASVTGRLAQFAYLNDPPTTTGELLANPILETLCKSFYEEEKWQRSLVLNVKTDDEWVSSVTVTMVALAATAYRSALEEWQSGRFIRKQFEVEKYTRTYTDIRDYIIDLLEHHPHADHAAGLLSSWAEESTFVQEFLEENPAEQGY